MVLSSSNVALMYILLFQETPVPGSYDSADFIIMLQKRPHSYRFKSDGRKSDPQPQIGKGATLLPGAYQHQDFLQR